MALNDHRSIISQQQKRHSEFTLVNPAENVWYRRATLVPFTEEPWLYELSFNRITVKFIHRFLSTTRPISVDTLQKLTLSWWPVPCWNRCVASLLVGWYPWRLNSVQRHCSSFNSSEWWGGLAQIYLPFILSDVCRMLSEEYRPLPVAVHLRNFHCCLFICAKTDPKTK